MKRLLIIRHAKSSWDFPELTDFERPINHRGQRDLPVMAQRLRKLNLTIDSWISSPANRAITTAIGHTQAFGLTETQIEQNHRLYHASSRELQTVISQTQDSIETLALFGHNPGLTDLINDLSDFELWNLPTCAVCGIEFDFNSWKEIVDHKGKKFYYDFPKSKQH